MLKTISEAQVGDETHPYPYPDESTVCVHDSVDKGRGGPRETIVWGIEVWRPGVVIVTLSTGIIACFGGEMEMKIRQVIDERSGGDL